HAFRVLPKPQRLAMCALYAYMRITDDLTDGPEPVDQKAAALSRWQQQFAGCLAGEFLHPIHPALHHTLRTYEIPSEYLEAVLDGVEMDLFTHAYEPFNDLYRYCYRVASAVGLACIHIWGFKEERAKKDAEGVGIAFQLTNILRDLREDAERGRVY